MKKTVIVIVIIAVLLPLGGVAVYAAHAGANDPTVDAVPLTMTLNAIKVNNDGETLGTVQIKLEGYGKKNPKPGDLLEVEIDPFDEYDRVTFFDTWGGTNEDNTNLRGKYIQYAPAKEYMEDQDAFYVLLCSMKYNLDTYYLGFTPDYQRWIIRDGVEGVSYLASTNENDTLEDLLEQFEHLHRVDIEHVAK